jgi:hypothetical protein
MNNSIVFCLAEHSVGGRIGKMKIVYMEYQDYWQRYHRLSGNGVALPLELCYYLHVTPSVLAHTFEVDNPSITEQMFINAGFIKDDSFAKYIIREKHL